MARNVFLILLLLNFLGLAWIFLQGDARINQSREPQRVLDQIAPEAVRIRASTGSNEEICRAYAAAALPQAQEVAKAWSVALPAASVLVNALPPTRVFEIVIAGIKTLPLAEKTLAELKALGLTQNGEIRKGELNLYTLAMASFTDRAAAEQALKNLTTRGLRLAAIAERQPETGRAVIEVRGRENVLRKLPELTTNFKTLTPATCAEP